MEQRPLADRVAAVSALDEPVRRALFDHVSRSETPVSRDEAAEAVGLPRSTAAFHLDRLVEEGLLVVEFRRLSGRTGPGAGRPSSIGEPVGEALRRTAERAGRALAADGGSLEEILEQHGFEPRPDGPGGLAAFEDHGRLARTLDAGVDEATEVMRRLAAVGVDMDDVGHTLEVEGVASFHDSFQHMLGSLAAEARQLSSR